MKKTILILMIFLLSSFVSAAFSEDRTVYYFDGTNFLTDNIESTTEIGLNGSVAVDEASLSTTGWSTAQTLPIYSIEQKSLGSLSIEMNGSIGPDLGIIATNADNATFRGKVGYKLYLVDGTYGVTVSGCKLVEGVDTTELTVSWRPGLLPTYWYCDGACDTSIAVTYDVWHTFIWNLTDGSNAIVYVDGVLLHTIGSFAGLGYVGCLHHNGAEIVYFDEFWVSNGNRTEAIPGPGIPDTPTIIHPSPPDNANNNTNQTLNVSHSTINNDVRYYLYFNSSTPLDEGDLIYNNVTRNGSEYSQWTTNVGDGTYYWKWKVQNTSNGLFSANTTERTWILDTTNPTITRLTNNNWKIDNSSILSPYIQNLTLNLSFFDETDLYQTLINLTYENGTSYYSRHNTSITPLHDNFSITIDMANFPIGNFTLQLAGSDSHTSIAIDDYDVQNGINTLEFNTPEGNRIWISSDGSSYSTLYNKKEDRYEFGWNYLLKDTERTFTIRAENKISYLSNSKYIGHFVILGDDSMGNWLDFGGIGDDYSVKKKSDFEYEISFINLPDDNKIISKSLGGLNKIEYHYLLRLGAVLDVWVFDEENYPNQINATATISTQSANSTTYTSGAKLINITKDVTSLTLNSSGFGVEEKTISVTSKYHNLSFNMSPTLATKLSFYDEVSNTLISGETFSVYLEKTGFSQTYSTSDNPYTITSLVGGLYKLKASSTNYGERQYLDLNVSDVSTTFLNVYLVNDTLGSEITFNIVGEALNPLENVRTVFTKIINGSSTVIAEEDSDFAGQVVLTLDSNTEYTINFSKSGYETKTIDLEPKNLEYVIIMISTVGAYNQSVYEGIRYKFSPSNIVLNNHTKYNFTFTLNSTVWDITNCNLTLKNGSNVLSTTSSFTSNSCYIRIEQDTFSMTNITSEAIYELNNQYAFTVSHQYKVIYTYEGDFSLKNFLDDLSSFAMAGFDDFGRMMLAFIVIFVILTLAATKMGFENKEVLIFIFWALVGFFSYLGWFTLGLDTMPNVLGLKKYFIFYLITLVCGAFIINRVRK